MTVTILLIVAAGAVLAGIAVVSTGHGGELAEPFPDRVPELAELVAGGTVTPGDLEQVRFPTGFWGYPPRQVDDVLDRATRALAERDARISDLEQRLLTHQVGAAGGGEPVRRIRPEGATGEEESW